MCILTNDVGSAENPKSKPNAISDALSGILSIMLNEGKMVSVATPRWPSPKTLHKFLSTSFNLSISDIVVLSKNGLSLYVDIWKSTSSLFASIICVYNQWYSSDGLKSMIILNVVLNASCVYSSNPNSYRLKSRQGMNSPGGGFRPHVFPF